jgi:hypothetical protein
MSRLLWLTTAAACCPAAVACSGCVRGVTYNMPMPESLTLGTVRGEEAAGLAAGGQRAAATRPAPGETSPSGNGGGGDGQTPVSLMMGR